MDAAQSTTRSRLLTLTSVAAAGYLGYFIFPLVGGGTASSAVQMCASKDVIFRRAGVARLRAVLRVSRDGAHVRHAVESGAGEILLRLVREDGAREPRPSDRSREGRDRRRRRRRATSFRAGALKKKDETKEGDDVEKAATAKASERRAVARDAADALLELAAASEETRAALRERAGFVKQVRAAAKDVALDPEIRAKLAAFATVAET